MLRRLPLLLLLALVLLSSSASGKEPVFVRGCVAGELQRRHPSRIGRVKTAYLEEPGFVLDAQRRDYKTGHPRTESADRTVVLEEKGRFVTIEGDDSYLTAAGEALTGLQTISGRTYCFDKKGKQFHGWKKVGDRYLYFARGRKEEGCLVTSGKPLGFAVVGFVCVIFTYIGVNTFLPGIHSYA